MTKCSRCGSDESKSSLQTICLVCSASSKSVEILKSEIADARRQRDEAQQQLNAAIVQQNQAQQNANNAQTMIVTASGAIQALEAALKLIEKGPNETPSPTP